MDYTLEIVEGSEKGKTAQFTGSQLIIGRDAGRCNLVLSDPEVSRVHARLTRYQGDLFYLEDLNSTYGTKLNSEPVREATLINSEDQIVIGSSTIKLRKNTLAGQKSSFIETARINVGRDPENDVVLSDPRVSRFHALVEKTPEGCYLIDRDSTHGTYLQGKRIAGQTKLIPGQYVHIGETGLLFDGSKLLFESGVIAASFPLVADDPIPFKAFLSAPFKSASGLKLLLAMVLSIIPIIDLFFDGYRYRMIQQGINGNPELPEWSSWSNLFISGVLLFTVRLIYFFLPVFLLVFFFAATYLQNRSTGLFIFLVVFTLITFSLPALIMPMASACFAASGRFGDAFNLPVILTRIKAVMRQYFLVVLFSITLWLLLFVVAIIPYIGFLFALIGSVYIYLVTAPLFGDLYRRSSMA